MTPCTFEPVHLCYNRRVVQMKITTDFALRALIVFAGGLAALLLSLKGQGPALPALAVGGTLGAFMMARFGPSAE